MKISKKILKDALEIVKPGLSSKENGLDQSTSFAFMGNRVVTYNDEISISHPVAGMELTGAIHADELYALLNKCKTDDIEMEVTGNEVLVTSGKAKAWLTMQSEIKLPLEELGEIGEWGVLPENFATALKFTMMACGRDMSKPILTCVNVESSGRLQSSDGYRLVNFQVGEIPVEGFLLPAASANKVVTLGPVEIAEGQGWIHFKGPEGTVISCRIWEDKFPNIDKIMNFTGVDIILPASIGEMLDRAAIFSKRDHFLDEMVYVKLEKGKLTLTANSDNGRFEEETAVRYKDKAITFAITPSLFKDIFSRTLNCVLGNNRVMFSGDDWTYVALLRANTPDTKIKV